MTDTVKILQDLIRCESVTPIEGGAITYIEKLLTDNGFECQRLKFSDKDTPDVENLYARFGKDSPNLCFSGHTDVVPAGDLNSWKHPPFDAVIEDGIIYGRGAVDMKGGIAAFISAALTFLKENKPQGSISFLITGDEEGLSINGTKKLIEHVVNNGEKIDFCIVGEPTSKDKIGDMVKIGRRGSLTGYITVNGMQGHVAYPHLADNPIPKLIALLKSLDDLELDNGTDRFQPSNLEIVKIDIDNKATNVIPEKAQAVFNIRFNNTYLGKDLKDKILKTLDICDIPYEINIIIGGECFYTAPGKHSKLLENSIKKITGINTELSTSGGSSDAKFITNYCPVIEIGLINKTIHKVNEQTSIDDLNKLREIYLEILKNYFKLT